MAKSKATSRSLSGSDDAYVLACTWRSSRFSSPWHGVSQDQQITSSHLRTTRFQLIVNFVVAGFSGRSTSFPAVEGSSIDPTKTIYRGITREPAPFQFRVRARHPDVERIIESESADADLRLKEWEY
jgi:hypothetical protein